MAKRRSRYSRRRTKTTARRTYSRRPVKRRSYGSRRSQRSQTLRIVVEQPASSPLQSVPASLPATGQMIAPGVVLSSGKKSRF